MIERYLKCLRHLVQNVDPNYNSCRSKTLLRFT